MEKKRKQWWLSELDWKSEVIVFLLLMASAFFINRGIKIKGLFMDDLYMWSCYGCLLYTSQSGMAEFHQHRHK